MDNREYIPSITCVNKVDLIDPEYKETVDEQLRERDLDPEEVTFISAEVERGLDALKDRIWENLGLIRVYMNKPGRGIDWDEPQSSSRVHRRRGDRKLGGEMEERFRFARVTGPSATHDEQQVGTDHVLEDEDVLKLILRR